MEAKRTRRRQPSKPYTRQGLDNLALWYVSRYATSEARLRRYLQRKVTERGLEGVENSAAAIDAITERLIALGALDDEAFAGMRVRALAARGKGQRVMAGDLAASGIAADIAAQAREAVCAIDTAVTFMQRRRLGPFGAASLDEPAERQRQMGRMARAGHPLDLARDLLAQPDVDALYAFVDVWKAERTD